MNSKLQIYVALLRGVNVGGNASVPMSQLKQCFESLGFSNVRTYINSGNVIFMAPKIDADKLEAMVEKTLHQQFSFAITVVVRDIDEITALINNVPANWRLEGQKLNVIFLRRDIDNPELAKRFKPKPGIEELHYYPGALLWSAQTSSLTRSNMIKLSRDPLYQKMTIRIFNTVKKIHQIMQEIAS